MQISANCKSKTTTARKRRQGKLSKGKEIAMKIFFFLMVLSSTQVFGEDYKETISISRKNALLKEIFKMVEKQSPYSFVYTDPVLAKARRVDIDVKDAGIEQVLKVCFSGQPLDYEIDNSIKVVIVKEKQVITRQEIATKATNPPKGVLSVKGKVTDETGIPIARTSVIVKGSAKATATDNKGEFSLNELEESAVLIFSCVGYERMELPLKGNTTISAKLKVAINSLDEAVVVAYGTSSQRTNTGAVTVVKGEQIQNLPNRSFDKSLQGLVPGLLVTSGTGQPGGGVSNFVLRGISTNASPENGSVVRNPLILIDGIPISQETTQMYITGSYAAINNPIAQLNPSDIENISILKDAAAIALYGAKSSNGVILITTKKGKAGRTRFNFRHQTDISTALRQPEMLNQDEYLELLYETYRNSPRIVNGVETLWTDEEILSEIKSNFPVQSNGKFYTAPDWQNELFRSAATTVANEISISGGNDRSNFYLNIEYTKQNGILKKTGFDRKSVRLNFENRPTSWFKIGLNTALSYSIQDYGGSSYGTGASNAMVSVNSLSPLNPIRLTNGEYYFNYSIGGATTNLLNPVAAAEYNTNKNVAFRGLSKLYLELNFLRHFKLSSNLGVDYMQSEAKEFADPRLIDPAIKGLGGRIEERDTRRANLITTNLLNFNQTFGKFHSVGFVVGQEAQILNQKVLGIAVTGITNPYYDQINSPGATVFSKSGYVLKETLLSYFGQFNYDYKNTYFLSSSIRRDGSSRFGEDKRFGTYWSTGIGWLLTSQSFMKDATNIVDYLKIRGSVGAAGNAGAIDRFTPYDRLSAGLYQGSTSIQRAGSQAGNADVKWEQTFSWDAGFEARFLKERLYLTADVYQRNTSNLIYSVPLPGLSGFETILANIGTIRNSGIELSLAADIFRSKSFRWNLSANWSTNKNVLIKANSELATQQLALTFNKEGENFNSYYMIRWAGVNPSDGSPQWIDSTGKPNNNYNAAKREFVGKPQPDGFGAVTNSITFKGFQLSIMLYYQYGYQFYNFTSTVHDGSQRFLNQRKEALNHWRKAGDVVPNPKPSLNSILYESTRYLVNGDHIRLQNVNLSYMFPNEVAKHMGISTIKVYVQGNSLALWAHKKDSDPSNSDVLGSQNYSYPNQRSFSIGVNLSF